MTIRPTLLGVLGLAAVILACAGAARPPAAEGEPTPLRLGTFDSRAVAVAWANSDVFDAELDALRAEVEAARADGDDARAAELEASAGAMQERLHRQGFSTASVRDILARYERQLPALAERAGVDAVVSRWDLAWHAPHARFVDVTDALVALIGPSEQGLQWARQVREVDPVPEDRARH